MDDSFWSPVWLSLKVAGWATLITVVFGTLAGKLMARRKFRGRTAVESLLLLPMVMPPTVVGFGLLVLLGKSGLGQIFPDGGILFTWHAAVTAGAVVAFPLMYQAAKTGFEMVDPELEAVATTFGANAWQVFWHVTLPLAWPVWLSGVLLSFVRALGEFGATLMVAGNIPGRTQTLPLGIYNAVESGREGLAWAWVACLFLFSFFMMWLIRRLGAKAI
ncbi:molybdate transport system permease protein [Tumebacillus sp. BK434]|uniref:molybdate ABC transporter permease subunit n=1 Tax=Tumebacillus sp. BK434 TaxID=2512169 RepID=UPI0010490909|nr:molybdate ABC transporter permease subunit [Tumebacillus sp. BK434]TCP52897.1 molybdate transport system permease protein [Tumebacillus sp. BK434]